MLFLISLLHKIQNEKTRREIISLVINKKIDVLKKLLLKRETFGTAGIRGVMRAGFSGMNDLVIIQTSQGLCEYLMQHYGSEETERRGIIIGYDGRFNSRRFAELTATAFLQKNIRVYLFEKIVPTPFIPFGILEVNAVAGVMITASHNPKDDNGYKVYFDNGSQIISPHDKNIQALIESNLNPWSQSWSKSLLNQTVDPMEHVFESYFDKIKARIIDDEIIRSTNLKFTYTSLHGVGHEYLTHAFEVCGFPLKFAVEEQKYPDPLFPTVVFPNPEEGKGVLDLSIKTANANGSTVILANDPDADRCAVAIKIINSGDDDMDSDGLHHDNHDDDDGNSWKILTGNEVGALLGWWMWFKHTLKSDKSYKPSDCYMLSSAVSSKILESMAKKEGFNFIETLTGFKWMGNMSHDLMAKSNKRVIFAFEEAIGYMCGTDVLDKDGISAAIEVAQLASYVNSEFGYTLLDQLNHIYHLYGYHTSLNSYYLCYDQSIISKIFHRLSNYDGPESYPKNIGPYTIRRVRDLNRPFDSETGVPVSLFFQDFMT